MSKAGCVYMFEAACAPAAYKVGIAESRDRVLKRLDGCQTGNPFRLYLVGVFESDDPRRDEKQIHARLRPYRIRREWFWSLADLDQFLGAQNWLHLWLRHSRLKAESQPIVRRTVEDVRADVAEYDMTLEDAGEWFGGGDGVKVIETAVFSGDIPSTRVCTPGSMFPTVLIRRRDLSAWIDRHCTTPRIQQGEEVVSA
jgi:hypothetical protein